MSNDPDLMVKIPKEPLINSATSFGMTVITVFFGGLIMWSVLAPLESSAIASGKVTVDSNLKSIQHLEGGIISVLHIREGALVKKDELLVTLQSTKESAQMNLLKSRTYELLAQEARLKAERDGTEKIIFPQLLLRDKNSPIAKNIMQSQQRILLANRKTLVSQLDIYRQRIKQLNKEIASLRSQVTAETEQLGLIKEEITAVAFLEKKKLIERPRLLALQREQSRLRGNRGEHEGLIARAEQRIGETKSQILAAKDKYHKETLDQLRDAQQKSSEVTHRMTAAEDVFQRTEIRSPIAGKVVALKHHTIGGVLRPGEEIMQIVPTEDVLVIEARISPLDIDIVREGLPSKITLSAFKQRSTPNLNGIVTHVSADSFQDKNSQATYYLARITISKKELGRLSKEIKLRPGMPAQVMIIVGKQSFISYLVSPFFESFNRAFRES